jgi:preprotein translocase SecE subunit
VAVSRITRFVQDSWQELKKVNWPTPVQARNLTILVFVVSVAVSVYISLFDYVFGWIAKSLNAG